MSSGWSLIRVASHQGGKSAGLSLWSRWYVIRVVSHQGKKWSGWSLIRAVCHQGGLSSGWPLIRVVSQPGCLFGQGGMSSGWSHIRVVLLEFHFVLTYWGAKQETFALVAWWGAWACCGPELAQYSALTDSDFTYVIDQMRAILGGKILCHWQGLLLLIDTLLLQM